MCIIQASELFSFALIISEWMQILKHLAWIEYYTFTIIIIILASNTTAFQNTW